MNISIPSSNLSNAALNNGREDWESLSMMS